MNLVGRQLGRYKVLEEIGSGGMGVVYRAQDVRLERHVALKLIRAEYLSRPEIRSRFWTEARAVSRLSHPSIGVIYEFDEVDDQAFMAMELFEGGSLRSHLADAPLPTDEVVRIGLALAAGLGHAHSRDVIHRDIKPDNILFTLEGEAKITDFGLAKFLNEALPAEHGAEEETLTALTRAGVMMGTIYYMAPEQATGRPTDHRADIFSLGVVLYQLTTGRLPFAGRTAPEALHALLHDQPLPLRANRPNCPSFLGAAVSRALMRDPDARFQSMAEFASALDAAPPLEVVSQLGAPAAKPMPRTTAEPFAGRNDLLNRLLALLDKATAGSGQVVFLAGETGSGKTRLVEELGRKAMARGIRKATGACLFREGVRPYRPVLDAVKDLLRDDGVQDASSLHTSIPAKDGSFPQLPLIAHLLALPGNDPSAATDVNELLETIETFVVRLTDRGPLLLHLKDLQWADEATLRLLANLAARCKRHRLMIVGSFRSEDLDSHAEGVSTKLGDILERLAGDPWCHRLDIPTFAQEELSELLDLRYEQHGFSPAFVERLWRSSSGNLLFITETLKLLEDEHLLPGTPGTEVDETVLDRVSLPTRIQALIERRLAPLEDAQREILEIAAVEGMVFHSSTISTCLEISRIPTLRMLQALSRKHRLIRSEGSAFCFASAMIRDVLYEQIPAELRIEFHKMVGQHLSEAHGNAPDQASSIAFQFLESEEEERALPFLVIAGRHARKIFATEESERLLTRALEVHCAHDKALCEDLKKELWWNLAELHVLTGAYASSLDEYQRFAELARAGGDPGGACRAGARSGFVHFLLGDYDQAEEAAAAARDEAERLELPAEVSEAQTTLGDVLWARGQLEAAITQHREALEAREGLGDSVATVESLKRIANILQVQGKADKALAIFHRSLGIVEAREDSRSEAFIRNGIGGVLLASGRIEEAIRWLERALSLREMIGDRRGASKSLNNLGFALERTGKLDQALKHYRQSTELKRELGDESGLANSLVNIASLHERFGQYEAALKAGQEGLQIKERLGARKEVPQCLTTQARLLWKLHRREDALPLLEHALEIAREIGALRDTIDSTILKARLIRDDGRPDEAAALLKVAIRTARRTKARGQEFLARYWSLRLALDGKELDEDACRLQIIRMQDLLEDLGDSELEARFEEVKGLFAAHRGDQSEAIISLGRAAEMAETLGARDLSWRIYYRLARVIENAGEAEVEGVVTSKIQAYRKAMQLVQEIASSIDDEDLRRSFEGTPSYQDIFSKAGSEESPG